MQINKSTYNIFFIFFLQSHFTYLLDECFVNTHDSSAAHAKTITKWRTTWYFLGVCILLTDRNFHFFRVFFSVSSGWGFFFRLKNNLSSKCNYLPTTSGTSSSGGGASSLPTSSNGISAISTSSTGTSSSCPLTARIANTSKNKSLLIFISSPFTPTSGRRHTKSI